jgi:S-adenosylmethionine hydrolase
MTPPIVLLTDFGSQDPFVGIMKGVLAEINPTCQLIDLTHEIPPGDIRRASTVLWQSFSYFTKGTIFLVVVDPGVGTARSPIILYSHEYIFIGPDNGVFTLILENSTRAWGLENPKYQLPNPGVTFHGRDIFAPAAAYASLEVHGSEFGNPIASLNQIQKPKLEIISANKMIGEILHADRFGNTLTSLGTFKPINGEIFHFSAWIGEYREHEISLNTASVHLMKAVKINWAKTFADIPENECGFIVGSSGLIEIVSNLNNAAELLGLEPGKTVELYYK